MRVSCGCRSHNGFLTAKGLKEADQRSAVIPEGLAGGESTLYLDRVGSVSAFEPEAEGFVWDELLIDSQYRRFLSEVL